MFDNLTAGEKIYIMLPEEDMSDMSGAVGSNVLLIVLIVLLALLFFLVERRRKRNLKKKFRRFSEDWDLSQKEMRAVPRITIPASLEVMVIFSRGKHTDLRARVVDMSLSGLLAEPTFPLRRLPLHAAVTEARLVTPVNAFTIKEMKTVRVERQVAGRMVAFHFESIAGDQFDELKKFMAYLDRFLKNEE